MQAHSFGERMKFLLTTALARDPDLLLFDEPTIGLDVHAQEVLADEIGRLRQSDSRSIVISSHQIGFLEQMADYVAILHKGKLLAMDRVDRLLGRYRMIDTLMPDGLKIVWDGIELIDYAEGRAKMLLDLTVTDLTRLTAQGVMVVEDAMPSLQELVSALTQGS